MSNRSNISTLPTTALPDTAATTLVATSRKHSHRPGIPTNASASLRSASCIPTYFPIARARGQWPHPSPKCELITQITRLTRPSNQRFHQSALVAVCAE